MTTPDDKPHPQSVDPEDPGEIIDDITSAFDDIQKDLSEGATLAGEEKERFELMRPAWKDLADQTTTDPDIADVYSSGLVVLAAFRDELFEFKPQVSDLSASFMRVLPSSDSTSSTTSATVSIVSHGSIWMPEKVTLPRYSRYEETRERLSNLDDALGSTYQSVREVLYGTRSDPARGALYLTRQLFDHFFGLLAPDEKVRASPFWTSKPDEDDPDLVTRPERVQYAAETHVADLARRSTLLASARHMVSVYATLNKAHKRESLDENQAKEALREMFTLIGSWAWAIEIPLKFN